VTPNLSPRSLRLSAEALRFYAVPPTDLECIPPILLEGRREILRQIAGELEALATEREVKARPWWRVWK
jgi:hypothetical protein